CPHLAAVYRRVRGHPLEALAQPLRHIPTEFLLRASLRFECGNEDAIPALRAHRLGGGNQGGRGDDPDCRGDEASQVRTRWLHVRSLRAGRGHPAAVLGGRTTLSADANPQQVPVFTDATGLSAGTFRPPGADTGGVALYSRPGKGLPPGGARVSSPRPGPPGGSPAPPRRPPGPGRP